MGSVAPPVKIVQDGAQNYQICTTPLRIIDRPPTAQIEHLFVSKSSGEG
jgi:hypothetical protein